MVLFIEGNIGAGKSTLLKRLAEEMPSWQCILEPLDTWRSLVDSDGINVLDWFYKDPTKYAYAFQSFAFFSRVMLLKQIDPAKDIDGIHPVNAGLLRLGYDGFLPATAHAAVEILRRSGIEIAGKHAVVIGRSPVVGMPAAFLLLREDATVTVCHRRTEDLADHVRRADIVVVAAGQPGLIDAGMLKPGAVVVDVGINVVGERIVGDVDFDSAARVASAITPVPGGVGPLTNALLLAHLMRAAEGRAGSANAT